MNIYTAIMRAADNIETEPELFDFDSIRVPGCGSPSCALGWIAHYRGGAAILNGTFDDKETIGVCATKFYRRMDELAHGWEADATICARGLRAYADKYHSDDKPAAGSWDALKGIYEPPRRLPYHAPSRIETD